MRSECFVYLQLPDSLDIVTCGRYEHSSDAGVGRFVYGRNYRARRDAVTIDPVHLPLSPQVRETARLGGIFGALRDASPDAWGRMVIERVLGRNDLSEIDFLLHSPEDRAGALSFGTNASPPAPVQAFNAVVHLGELREAARAIESGDAPLQVNPQVHDLLEPTTSMGGARPKNTVEDDNGLWVAKFPARGDRWNNAAIEAAMLHLASRCDIQVPEMRIERLKKESILLLRRFDREKVNGGYHRHRMVSALTMVDAEESPTDTRNWSYLLIADELQRWSSRPREDRAELFRRVVFNALISNNDDHPRNHAAIARAEWRLSPAYDLTPSPQHGRTERSLALICGRHGRAATRQNLLSASQRFGLSVEDAGSVIDRILEIVRHHWRSDVRKHGGTEKECEWIASAFVHDGFEYVVA